jgi:hypothetical protein
MLLTARGTLSVSEARDERSKRTVRTAEFRRVDGGEPIPMLRDVELVYWGGQWVILAGVEEVADDRLSTARRYEQTWQMVPEPFADLGRAERRIARLCHRLRQLDVAACVGPDGRMFIAGGTRP